MTASIVESSEEKGTDSLSVNSILAIIDNAIKLQLLEKDIEERGKILY